MFIDVLLLVCGLIKGSIAALYWTFERLFSSVDANMVEEIVPFGKNFLTALECTDVGIRQAPARYTDIAKYDEVLGLWDRRIASSGSVNLGGVEKFHRCGLR